MHSDIHEDNLLDEKCLSRKRQIFLWVSDKSRSQDNGKGKEKAVASKSERGFFFSFAAPQEGKKEKQEKHGHRRIVLGRSRTKGRRHHVATRAYVTMSVST